MLYLTDKDINDRLNEHLQYYQENYSQDWFVICAQGSMNYGLMNEESDVDTKVLTIPAFQDIVFDKEPVSHTLEMPDNQEHVDCKDIRKYFKLFRKSNINFVEILFTDYWIANEKYIDLWLTLRQHAEEIARINPHAAVSCMQGMALEKRKALTNPPPSRRFYVERHGWDFKQLVNIVRINYFIKQYAEETPYRDCLRPEREVVRKGLLDCKKNGWGLSKKLAEAQADEFIKNITEIANNFKISHENKVNLQTDELLNDVLYQIIKRSLKEELSKR